MLLTVHQVAERLTVSRPTVWRYVRRNPTFPKPVRLSPGCTRWRAEAIEEWKAARERIERAEPLTPVADATPPSRDIRESEAA